MQVRTYDESSAARRRRMANIRLFMAFHSIPAALQTKMLLHAEGDWLMTNGMDVAHTLRDLPAALRAQILIRMHQVGAVVGIPSGRARGAT